MKDIDVFSLPESKLGKIIIVSGYFNPLHVGHIQYFHNAKSHGDKLYKLAHRYYGSSGFFWIIAMFNNKPTDAHYNYGDIVLIPENSRGFVREVTR